MERRTIPDCQGPNNAPLENDCRIWLSRVKPEASQRELPSFIPLPLLHACEGVPFISQLSVLQLLAVSHAPNPYVGISR